MYNKKMIHGPVNDKDVCSYINLTEIAGLNSNRPSRKNYIVSSRIYYYM